MRRALSLQWQRFRAYWLSHESRSRLSCHNPVAAVTGADAMGIQSRSRLGPSVSESSVFDIVFNNVMARCYCIGYGCHVGMRSHTTLIRRVCAECHEKTTPGTQLAADEPKHCVGYTRFMRASSRDGSNDVSLMIASPSRLLIRQPLIDWQMDHHCPWMNNCVGYLNYRYFVLFLMYMFIGCVYAVLISMPQFLAMAHNPGVRPTLSHEIIERKSGINTSYWFGRHQPLCSAEGYESHVCRRSIEIMLSVYRCSVFRLEYLANRCAVLTVTGAHVRRRSIEMILSVYRCSAFRREYLASACVYGAYRGIQARLHT